MPRPAAGGGSIFGNFWKSQRLPGKRNLRRRLLLAAKVIVLGVTLTVVAALSAYFTVRKFISGGDVQVPDIAQMTVNEAASLLKAKGLVLEEAAQRNDARVEAGRILAQDPPAGSDIKQQRKVKVVVSLGDRINAIPELRGGAARKAQITLQQQGLRLGTEVYAYSRREGENLVIAQDPMPGGVGARDGKVGLLVSRGAPPRTYVMPNLVGRPEAEAVAFLAHAGLKTAPVRHDPGHPDARGNVVAQQPEAGYPIKSGDLVTLTVGQGSESGG